MKLTINEEKNEVTLVLPLTPETSKSGKMTLLASTHGWVAIPEAIYNGKVIQASVNIGVKR